MTESEYNAVLARQRLHFQAQIDAMRHRWRLAQRYLDKYDLGRIDAAMRLIEPDAKRVAEVLESK